MDSLVSIIVPIYNAEKYLVECINSIRNQTYKSLQIILVNDGSTDNSLEICESFEQIDSRILIINQKNSGVSSARNRGIEAADGEYIGFVDSDDYLNHEMYEKLLCSISNNNTDLCVLMNHTIRPINPRILNSNRLNKCEAIRELFLLRFPSSLWAYLYKKEVIKGIRLNNNIHFFEDFEINYRILNNANSVSLCFEDLYHYRIHVMSTNNQSINNKRMTCLNIFELHQERILNSDCKLAAYSNFYRSHFLISVIVSIVKSNKVDQRYIKVTKSESKMIYKDMMFSKYVPLNYKMAISIYLINPSLLKMIINMRK